MLTHNSGASRRENADICCQLKRRHWEQPTGRADARPMTGSATKPCIVFSYCFLALFFSRATMIGALLWEDVLRSPLHSDRAGGFSLYNPRCS